MKLFVPKEEFPTIGGWLEWTEADEHCRKEAKAIKRAFRSVTRCGRPYRKPRGKNGMTPARAAKDAKRLSAEIAKSVKEAREARVKAMIARILDGDEE